MIGATTKVIDVQSVINAKIGTKAKFVPKILVRALEKLIHQDELNHFLSLSEGKVGSDWLQACLEYLGMSIKVVGSENLPDKNDGRYYTFVSNHPLGGIDGIALGALIGKHYDDNFRYLVNELLMYLPGLAPLCIPVSTSGKRGRDFPAMVEAGFKGENHIVMFPAGLCSRRHGGVVRDPAWKKTFITKSVQTKRDVVPIYFEGTNSNFFYHLANFSDRFMKINIARLFLPDEMFKNRGKTFTITIGEPIPWYTFTKDKTPMKWAKFVEDKVYQLPEKVEN